MKYYILLLSVAIKLMAASDLGNAILEMLPRKVIKNVHPPVKQFKFGAPLTKTEDFVKKYLKEADVLDFDFPELVGVAYEFPRFRHQIRGILKDDLDFFSNDPLILSVAYDIVSLREKADILIEKNLRDSVDDTLLQVASNIPRLRLTVLSAVTKSIARDNYSPKILQVALSFSNLNAKAMQIITNQLKEDDVSPELLQVAYDIPEFKEEVISIVNKKLPSRDLGILEIAAKEKSLRAKAVLNVKKLLPSTAPKVIRLALLLEL